MPIFQIDSALYYYAHVPKCAGSSVEDYLTNRFGALAFVDTKYMSIPADKRWSKTSPQHISYDALERLFPSSFFKASFAVVRHPASRIVSGFKFQRDVEKTIAPNHSFSLWLETLLKTLETTPFHADNHFLPQLAFVPPGADVFHLEDGLEALIGYFDALEGTARPPRVITATNVSKKSHTTGHQDAITLTAADLSCIHEIYAQDFEAFGYDRAPGKPKRGVNIPKKAPLKQAAVSATLKKGLAALRRKI